MTGESRFVYRAFEKWQRSQPMAGLVAPSFGGVMDVAYLIAAYAVDLPEGKEEDCPNMAGIGRKSGSEPVFLHAGSITFKHGDEKAYYYYRMPNPEISTNHGICSGCLLKFSMWSGTSEYKEAYNAGKRGAPTIRNFFDSAAFGFHLPTEPYETPSIKEQKKDEQSMLGVYADVAHRRAMDSWRKLNCWKWIEIDGEATIICDTVPP